MNRFLEFSLILSIGFISTSLFCCSPDGSSGFFPPNNLVIPPGSKSAKGITEIQYNTILTKIETIYAPLIAETGHDLQLERLWKSGSVNAEAEQMNTKWVVRMFGGLARYRTMTEDAFALVACHELGHHIGGAPKYLFDENRKWATSEGQADYFASLKCLRRIWLHDDNASIVNELKISQALLKLCQTEWSDLTDQAICLRSGTAANVIGEMLAFMRRYPSPRIERPDLSEVAENNENHNSPQCRLDTFIQGALCEKSFYEDVSYRSVVEGTCHESTGQTVGLRPRCWFKP